jgi:hypothetical protein
MCESATAVKERYPVNSCADLELTQAVVLLRGDEEIQFFHGEKDAGAWMQHVYGCRPYEGREWGVTRFETPTVQGQPTMANETLRIQLISDRGPKAGDLLIYADDGEFYHHGVGILDHSYGAEVLSVCFDASTYREGCHISCSGGPIPSVDPADLEYDGLREATYWRWWDGTAGGGQGGYYRMLVPSWRWNGGKRRTE